MRQQHCGNCKRLQLGWNDDWIDGDYHDYVCKIGGVQSFIIDSNDYKTEEAIKEALTERGNDCSEWLSKSCVQSNGGKRIMPTCSKCGHQVKYSDRGTLPGKCPKCGDSKGYWRP